MTGDDDEPVYVTFGMLSFFQKPRCLFCKAPATQEARHGDAAIRCCHKVECMEAAASTAVGNARMLDELRSPRP